MIDKKRKESQSTIEGSLLYKKNCIFNKIDKVCLILMINMIKTKTQHYGKSFCLETVSLEIMNGF